MASDIAIRVEGVSKSYHIYDNPRDRLKQSLWLGRKQFYREFKALDDVSFEVKKGESVGIIGRNGSGKSTLLQMICGTLAPTTGDVEVHGRIGALLELGSGFNPEFTGKENVYMNGAILGLSKKEIDARYEEIIAFSEIGEFINQPVNTYSSGMMVRLAFAVQVAVEPDILIVDEALSVGDFFFQQKCFSKIKELQQSGMTLLFVSHDTGVVRDLCSKCVYLKHGELMFWGDNLVGIRQYLSEDKTVDALSSISGENISQETAAKVDSNALLYDALWRNPNPTERTNPKATILAVGVYDASGEAVTAVEMGSEIIVRVMYQVFVNESVNITVVIKNKSDQIVTATGSHTLNIQVPTLRCGSIAVFEMHISMMLESGEYGMKIYIGTPIDDSNVGISLCESPWLGPIQTLWDYDRAKPLFYGLVGLPCEGAFISSSEDIKG